MATLKLLRYVPITGTVHCLTGLRIGGSKDDIEIGGVDSPIIRDARTRLPYIPGSSLKGKLRSSLEFAYKRFNRNGGPCDCGRPDCAVCTLFGPHNNTRHDLGPTRILVRDARMNVAEDENPDKWVEIKSETAIDRNTGIAMRGSLRQIERVVAGAEFSFAVSMRVFETDNEAEHLKLLREGFDLIQEDYLGASGSRGYGHVKFRYTAPLQWREQA